MDGENNGKPYEQMDDLGVPLVLETPISISNGGFFLSPPSMEIPYAAFSWNFGRDPLRPYLELQDT